MTSRNEPREYPDLDRSVSEIVDAVRLTIRLLNTLVPVAEQLRGLQDTLLDLQSSALGSPPGSVRALPPGAPSPAGAAEPTSRRDEHGSPRAEPAPVESGPGSKPATENGVAARVEPAERTDHAAEDGTTHPPGGKRTVSVTVSRPEGSLDLVRVHGALESIPGVTGLALTSYTRGRAGILLETDRPPSALELDSALTAVFPEGVNGGWQGESEYVAVIGAREAGAVQG
jgi:hypothetical protein